MRKDVTAPSRDYTPDQREERTRLRTLIGGRLDALERKYGKMAFKWPEDDIDFIMMQKLRKQLDDIKPFKGSKLVIKPRKAPEIKDIKKTTTKKEVKKMKKKTEPVKKEKSIPMPEQPHLPLEKELFDKALAIKIQRGQNYGNEGRQAYDLMIGQWPNPHDKLVAAIGPVVQKVSRLETLVDEWDRLNQKDEEAVKKWAEAWDDTSADLVNYTAMAWLRVCKPHLTD